MIKVNDRVRCYRLDYNPKDGVVYRVLEDGSLSVILDGNENMTIRLHSKHCRKLKPRGPRREIWVYDVPLNGSACYDQVVYSNDPGLSTERPIKRATKFRAVK